MKTKTAAKTGQTSPSLFFIIYYRANKVILLFLLAFINLNFHFAVAQELRFKIPAISQGQRIEQDLGLGTVSVKYYRPNTNGRKVFNGITPYGLVWRTGANDATVITLTDTINIEGHTLGPGAYALFSIPGPDEWTIILNKTTAQWGAYSYDEKQDLIRFRVNPGTLAQKVETLTIQFADVHQENCVLQLQWENTGINLRLTTDIGKRVMANIQEGMKSDKKPYYLAAVWYYNHGGDINQALAWMLEAEKAMPTAYFVKYWLARIQLKAGDKQSAIITANEGIKLATAQNGQDYIRMNAEVVREANTK